MLEIASDLPVFRGILGGMADQIGPMGYCGDKSVCVRRLLVSECFPGQAGEGSGRGCMLKGQGWGRGGVEGEEGD
jgi:hypothetical protein